MKQKHVEALVIEIDLYVGGLAQVREAIERGDGLDVSIACSALADRARELADAALKVCPPKKHKGKK